MTPEQVAELEALAEKATPGPWRAFCGATHTRVYSDADGTVQVAEIAGPSDVGIRPWNGERWEADASLISVLVNNLPAILAALKAQQPDDAMVARVARVLAPHMEGGREFDQMPHDRMALRKWAREGMCNTNDATQDDALEAAQAAIAAMQEKPND